jgi:hypothetical protein
MTDPALAPVRRPDARGRPSSGNAGGFADSDALAVLLSGLAQRMQQERSVPEVLDGIVHAAVDNIPGARWAGITQVQRRRTVRTTASTDPLVVQVDEVQYSTGEGPCLSAIYDHATVRLTDMRSEARWPRFAAGATELGIGSMLAFQLFVHGEDLGALNLFSPRVAAFDDESEHVGLLLASHAAVALAGAQRAARLTGAMDTRDLIGQAKGILMERHRLGADEAFALLVRASQDTGRKLRDVAEHLAASGELAGRAPAERVSPAQITSV